MAAPNQFVTLPRDGNGNFAALAYKATTGTLTLATGTATDDLVIPKGCIAISFWATVAFGFLGVGTSSGTEVACLASTVYTVGTMGADGSTLKAFFDRNVTTPGTVNYILHMGESV